MKNKNPGDSSFELVVGLEIHLQLATESKMFCGCANDPFNSDPNSNVCPVCLGLPGALPVPNKEAIILAQKMAHALGSNLNSTLVFERKNYFYPDIPKGYQITSPHYPVSTGGELDMSYWKFGKVRYREIHIEEDTAKSIHQKDATLIDFNKSGVPLLEIVTEPDFHSIEQAIQFSKEVQLLARRLNVSHADMEKGHLRLEANISARKKPANQLPDYRVEMKNINSFGFMKKALEYEFSRQVKELESGNKIDQETRGFNEVKGETFVQRFKEEAHDYRYFPEPDIPPVKFDPDWLKSIKASLPQTSLALREKLHDQGLNKQFIEVLTGNPSLFEKYNELVELDYEPKKAAGLVINMAKYKNKSAEEIHQEEEEAKSSQITGENELLPIIKRIIAKNPKAVEDYKSGNKASAQYLVGQVMKLTQGKADPNITGSLLKKELTA